ncbi:hypothetical protein Poli38472_003572 [Pythium oligandrum]|uniref:Pyridoxal phosphate phosphatase n=1 Tax=Pythium oligandrum TaxID=41045 RepID=A0A8K1FNF3_PYTOL|nr:hypothetical protein Poli38472_003572 [Pythium oligandrum]|eukprot:TMW65807.1 hypothetical protein Poli38472_003572 [Pythium oligandrum]
MSASPSTLIIFDYDLSLVNDDSDQFIYKQLCPELLMDIFKRMKQDSKYIPKVDDVLEELHERRPELTENEIRQALAEIPVLPRMLDAVRRAVDRHGASVKIISDANTVYIQSMLDHHQLNSHITEVYTNPSAFDTDKPRLLYQSYHPEHEKPHGCEHCPTNMCKGRILDDLRNNSPVDRIIYVGDGKGDFCPALRLTSRDTILARANDEDGKSYGLLERLVEYSGQVQAQVVTWRTGEDVYEYFERALTSTTEYS